MTNAVLVGLTFGIGGLIFAVLINVIGNRQDRSSNVVAIPLRVLA